MKKKSNTLDQCSNMFGRLSTEMRGRIKTYLQSPTSDTWESIQGIVICPGGMITTVWQAMINFDPTFPKEGPPVDVKGRRLGEWERIPMPLQLLQAIRLLTSGVSPKTDALP